MTWLRVDDGAVDHPDVLAIGDAAWGGLVRLATWSAKHLQDGRVAEMAARLMVPAPVIDRLVEQGMLVPTAAGFEVTTPLLHIRTAAEVTADRRAAADRQAAYRAKRRGSNGVTHAGGPGVSAGLVGTGASARAGEDDAEAASDVPDREFSRSHGVTPSLRAAFHEAWNTPPPDVDRWLPSNTNLAAFGDVAAAFEPVFVRQSSDAPAFAREVLVQFLAVHARWAQGGGAPPLTPTALAKDQWAARVQEALAGRLSEVGPPRPRAAAAATRPPGARGRVPVAQDRTDK